MEKPVLRIVARKDAKTRLPLPILLSDSVPVPVNQVSVHAGISSQIEMRASPTGTTFGAPTE